MHIEQDKSLVADSLPFCYRDQGDHLALLPPPVLPVLEQIPIPVIHKPNGIQRLLLIPTKLPPKRLADIFDLLPILGRRYRNSALADDPVQRDGCWRFSVNGADAEKFVDYGLYLGPADVAKVAVAAWEAVGVVFTCEAAEADGGVGDEGELGWERDVSCVLSAEVVRTHVLGMSPVDESVLPCIHAEEREFDLDADHRYAPFLEFLIHELGLSLAEVAHPDTLHVSMSVRLGKRIADRRQARPEPAGTEERAVGRAVELPDVNVVELGAGQGAAECFDDGLRVAPGMAEGMGEEFGGKDDSVLVVC